MKSTEHARRTLPVRSGHLRRAVAFCLFAGALSAQDESYPDFDLRIDGAHQVSGEPGEVVDLTADVVLSTRDNPEDYGSKGWSLSIASEGALSITDATTEGTVAAPAPAGLRSNGFEQIQLTTGEGNEGVVSAIVLSYTRAITLPPEGDATVLRLSVRATVPASGSIEGSLEFRDGLQGTGIPVNNRINYGIDSRTDDGGERDNDDDAAEPLDVRIFAGTGPRFVRGNCDGSSAINLTDAIFVLRYLFVPGGATPACFKACDLTDDGEINLTDPIYLLQSLFVPGARPPPVPYPLCGPDATVDELACTQQPACAG